MIELGPNDRRAFEPAAEYCKLGSGGERILGLLSRGVGFVRMASGC